MIGEGLCSVRESQIISFFNNWAWSPPGSPGLCQVGVLWVSVCLFLARKAALPQRLRGLLVWDTTSWAWQTSWEKQRLLIVSLCLVLESGRLCISCITVLWGHCVLLRVSCPEVNPECCAGKVQLLNEGERKKQGVKPWNWQDISLMAVNPGHTLVPPDSSPVMRPASSHNTNTIKIKKS